MIIHDRMLTEIFWNSRKKVLGKQIGNFYKLKLKVIHHSCEVLIISIEISMVWYMILNNLI